MTRQPPLFAWLAFASICFFWGTTYLGIRVALESLPPFVLLSYRFLISGSIMIATVRLRRIPFPRGRHLLYAAGFGVMILGVGNGCLTFAERLIPSGLAAIIVATSPIWMVVIEALVPGGERLTRGIILGISVGLAGTAVLVGPDVFRTGISGNVVQGFLILQFGCISWCLGSIVQRRVSTHVDPVASAAIQQFAAGLFYLPAALPYHTAAVWDFKGTGAMLYLVVFGSLVGYTSYIVALRHLPVSVVSLYNYINPVVAALLGWMAYREPFGEREVIAMGVIFVGVAIVKRFGHR